MLKAAILLTPQLLPVSHDARVLQSGHRATPRAHDRNSCADTEALADLLILTLRRRIILFEWGHMKQSTFAMIPLLLLASACGGGGESTDGGTVVVPPAPTPTPTPTPTPPTLDVALSRVAVDLSVTTRQSARSTFTATYTGSSSMPVVPDVTVSGDYVALAKAPVGRDGLFEVTIKSLASAPKGQSSANVTFRLCTSADCATVYPGSTKQLPVKLTVGDANWSTFQGDAGHTGYLPASYSTASFADAWTITTPYAPSGVAARPGSVFFNVAHTDGHVYTHAVSTASGATLWAYDVGGGSYAASRRPYAPSYANDRVASMPSNSTSSANPLQVINATTGGYVSAPNYDAQHSDGSAVTAVGDELFFASGYYGNVVFAANAISGDRLWRTEATGSYGGYVMEGESVAVDENYVYFFKGGSLVVLGRDGALVKALENQFFSKNGLSYFGGYQGAPVLDGNGRIFTFIDNYSYSQSLPLAAFSLTADRAIWRTSYSYTGQPAVRGNRLFAIRSSSRIVDLIDVATGLVSGSIDVGGPVNLTGNVVLTDSHLFVSSATTTYAVDLNDSSYPVVWRTSFGGELALTPDGYLTISTSTGLHAVKLG